MSTRKLPHQRSARRTPRPATNAQALHRLHKWLLPNAASFAGLRLHGNASWTPVNLVWTALCWAWSESRNVTDAFEAGAFQCRQLGIAALSTYQGFMNVLVKWTDPLMEALWPVLHQRLSEIGGRYYRVHGWVPIAFDGSRSSAPRTQSNERALCAANHGQGKTARYRKKKTKGMRRRQNEKHKPQPPAPQVWITLLWHIGLRLPWMWRLGPSNSSEREHVLEMLERGDFPEHTLFCGDAGFVGYPLWSQILDRGFDFLVRVGANVTLLTETGCRILRDGQVLSWPNEAQRAGKPPLHLRLLKVRIGKSDVWMVTSVQASSRLPATQVVRLYKLRWGIEVEFRGLKQTLDRGKLRCRNDRRVLAELNWSLLAMAVAELLALKEQLGRRSTDDARVGDPRRRSLANAVRTLRHALARIAERPPPGCDVRTRLRMAVTDSYLRHSCKTARYRPPNPDARPCGAPKLRRMTLDERTKLAITNSQKNAA